MTKEHTLSRIFEEFQKNSGAIGFLRLQFQLYPPLLDILKNSAAICFNTVFQARLPQELDEQPCLNAEFV